MSVFMAFLLGDLALCASQATPRCLSCGDEWACPDGKRAPFTKSTFMPSSTNAMPSRLMLNSSVFVIVLPFSTANIGKYVKLFATYRNNFVT